MNIEKIKSLFKNPKTRKILFFGIIAVVGIVALKKRKQAASGGSDSSNIDSALLELQESMNQSNDELVNYIDESLEATRAGFDESSRDTAGNFASVMEALQNEMNDIAVKYGSIDLNAYSTPPPVYNIQQYTPTPTPTPVTAQGATGYYDLIAGQQDNSILMQMQANSAAWWTAKTTADKTALHDANVTLSEQLKSMGYTPVYDSASGKWTVLQYGG